jgi:hypothetical protein
MFAVTHVIPSFEYTVENALKGATATNRPVVGLTVTEYHAAPVRVFVATHVIPSFEYAAVAEL